MTLEKSILFFSKRNIICLFTIYESKGDDQLNFQKPITDSQSVNIKLTWN